MIGNRINEFEKHSVRFKSKLAYKVARMCFIFLYVLDYEFLSCKDIVDMFPKIYGNRYNDKLNGKFIGQVMRFYKPFFNTKNKYTHDNRRVIVYIRSK